jgi:hypothetical protein
VFVLHTTGEFQEVVDAKLRHTHPRVQKQRAAAASLASAVASTSALQSMDLPTPSPSDTAADIQQQQQQLEGRTGPAAADLQAAAAAAGAAAAAAVNEGVGIQVVHVVPWQDPSSSSSSSRGPGGAAADEVLLEMDHVSINTPDGGLALVQDLNLKVHAGERAGRCMCICCSHLTVFWRRSFLCVPPSIIILQPGYRAPNLATGPLTPCQPAKSPICSLLHCLLQVAAC